MSECRVVLLDLDGTLIDPKPGILGSVQYALRKMGHEPPPVEELTWAIGPALRTTFTQLVGEAHAETAVAHYRQNYSDGAMYDCVLYAGIIDALRLLADGGRRQLFIVTAKPHLFAGAIAERLGLMAHVAGVYGPELDGTRDDKAHLLAHVLEREAIQSRTAVMIGDRKFDMLAARANAVAGIGVTWGYGTREELLDAGADRLCDAPADLDAAVKTLFR